MISLTALLLPAAAAAVVIFFVSFVIHMVIQWHKPDYRRLPDEDGFAALVRKMGATPGQYMFPHCASPKDMQDPSFVRKQVDGPIGVLYLRPAGVQKLGPHLLRWVLYTLCVGLLAGYIARCTLGPGVDAMVVFRVVAGASWLAYAWQSPSDSIWKGKPWVVTFREMVDGLVYASITGAAFAWLWPS